jgi:outer membrane protein assembly factor BamE
VARLINYIALTLAVLFLSACTVYKLDIQQGNIIENEDLEKIEVGMTRDQVQYLLGTPLIVDPFHRDRWDYVYYEKIKGEDINRKVVTLFFEDDKLARSIVEKTPLPPEEH